MPEKGTNSTASRPETQCQCPYKDDLPLHTITRIRRILDDLGALVVETDWVNNLDAIYSCRITLPGMDVGTNGKGLSPEYALAAAYAELMERLQNFWLFPLVEMSPKSLVKHGFHYDPSEKIYSGRDLPSLPEAFRSARVTSTSDKTVYDDWEEVKKGLASGDRPLSFTPFFNVRQQDVEYLPWDYLKHMYWSNGMCAGNSPEEALSQGLSEILERYAFREVYYRRLTPPTVPDDYLRQSAPRASELIRELEKAGDLTIIVKDCSLGLGLPVIGVIVIFRDTDSYVLKFGSDPLLSIALERCLTEFLQGRLLTDYPVSTPLDLTPQSDRIKDPESLRHFLVGGPGRCSSALFDSTPSYSFSGFPEPRIDSQRDKLDFLLKLISGLNHSVYVRDVSFLGFDSYCIVVPGLSEHLSYSGQRWDDLKKKRFSDISRVTQLSRMNRLSEQDLAILAEDMRKRMELTVDGRDILFSEYVGFPCTKGNPWNKLTLDLVLGMIQIRLGRFEEAHGHMSRFLTYARRQKDRSNLKFYSVLTQFLALLSRGRNTPDQAAAILAPVMGDSTVNKVRQLFGVREHIFRYLPLPAEWHCERCQVAPYCHYPTIEQVYLRLKDKLKESSRDQRSLMDLFPKRPARD